MILGVGVPTVDQFSPAGISDPDDELPILEFEAKLATIDDTENL